MILWDLLRRNKQCQHGKVSANDEFAYCPDCGELVENQWHLVRCNCCGVKLPATIHNGEVIASENFCHNCGENEYSIERIDKINFIDIRFAVLVKMIVQRDLKEFTQSWVNSDYQNITKKYISAGV